MRAREMREGRRKSQRRVKEGGEDRISRLPNSVIHLILSMVSTIDAVRTSVLSKHWKDQWKFTSKIDLDQKTMPSGEIQKYVRLTKVEERLDRAQRRVLIPNWNTRSVPNPIVMAENWIERVINQHSGPLTSCRIQHMIESVGEAKYWVCKLLVEKNVKELSMERDPPTALSKVFNRSMINPLRAKRASELYLSFQILAGFETVEFKNYHLYISSPPSSFDYPHKLKTIKLTLVLMPPMLATFLSECLSLENVILDECNVKEESNVRKFKINNASIKLLDMKLGSISSVEICAVNLEILKVDTVFCYDSESVVIVAPNLKVLHCYCLQKHKILILGDDSGFIYISRILEGLFRDVTLEGRTYPTVYENLESLHIQLNLRNERDSMLLAKVLKSCNSLLNLVIENKDMEEFDEQHDRETWRLLGSFKCIKEKLKTVSIRGFKGKVLELDFVKCLITMSEKMEKITIWFDDDSKLEDVTETMCLLSLPKSSANLSINLKPGKKIL